MPAIETSALTKYYGASRGIDGLNLTVGAGEVFGLLGPNGAGKTTAIRLLLDLIRPTRGSARVHGLDVREQSLEVRRMSGYVPGELRLPERPTARDYLTHLSRLRDGAGESEIEGLAGRLGLALDRQIGDLSKGNKQKVGVVAAFMHDPRLLILDEPTSGLDPLRQHDVQEMIRERAAAGRTVFLSSHALDQVEHTAHRVGIVREGELIAVEEIAALKQRAVRWVQVSFKDPVPADEFLAVAGVREASAHENRVRVRIEGPMDPLIKALARHQVQTLTSEEPDLDEIFLAYYERPDET